MRLVCFLFAYLGLLVTSVSGSVTMSLGTDAPPGSPLVFDAGTTSGKMLINVTNLSGNPSAPEDFMSGWQTTLLTIVGDVGSTGTVGFNSAIEPTTDYVFDGIVTFGFSRTISTTNTTDDTLTAFDASFSGGVDVSETGDNLIELDLFSSLNASGLFAIIAEPTPLSEWTDSAQPDQGKHTFANSGRIGEVFVVAHPGSIVPEPSSSAIWCIVGFTGYFLCRRKRGRK